MKFSIKRFQALIRLITSRRRLAKSGYSTWESYARSTDKLVCFRASRLRDFYHGYRGFYVFESSKGLSAVYGDWRRGVEAMTAWCEQVCQHKWRHDYHRVIKCPATADQWEINDIGGRDVLVFAFADDEDQMMFTLRWAS